MLIKSKSSTPIPGNLKGFYISAETPVDVITNPVLYFGVSRDPVCEGIVIRKPVNIEGKLMKEVKFFLNTLNVPMYLSIYNDVKVVIKDRTGVAVPIYYHYEEMPTELKQVETHWKRLMHENRSPKRPETKWRSLYIPEKKRWEWDYLSKLYSPKRIPLVNVRGEQGHVEFEGGFCRWHKGDHVYEWYVDELCS